MRAWLLATVLVGAPVGAQAQGWCPVAKVAGQSRLSTLTDALHARLDSQPTPLAHIHTEGTLPHQGIRDQSMAAARDWPVMRDAAYAWQAGAGDAYLALATRYFKGWIRTYQPDFNPIDETNLDTLIQTYAVIAPSLKADDRAAAQAFLRAWAQGYIASIDSHHAASISPAISVWNNNWQSHRVKLVTMIAVALKDDALFRAARRLFQTQIAANMQADGEVIDFRQRDALHYVVYDLEPLAQAALAARLRGEDWFNARASNGASLAKGFVWLKPYVNGEKTHEEFVHSTVRFDAQRANAGERGYSGPFVPQSAGMVMWLGAAFDPSYLPVAQALKSQPPAWLAICGV